MLERRDLSSQLAAALAGLLACARKGVPVRVRGRFGDRLGGDVQGGGHLTRVDAGAACLARRIRGYLAYCGRLLSDACHECAGPLAAVDQPLLLQTLVDRTRGVGVDPEHLGKFAQPGQPLSGREPPIADPSTQPPSKLDADRDLPGTVDRQVFELELSRRRLFLN